MILSNVASWLRTFVSGVESCSCSSSRSLGRGFDVVVVVGRMVSVFWSMAPVLWMVSTGFHLVSYFVCDLNVLGVVEGKVKGTHSCPK